MCEALFSILSTLSGYSKTGKANFASRFAYAQLYVIQFFSTHCSMSKPAIDSPAPAFSAKNQNEQTIALADFAGKTVVLYFYPKDDTPGCTTQACGLRDSFAEIAKTGAIVLGVSPDTPASHRKFIDKYGLPFDLLADEDHAISEAYGVWVEKSMYGKRYFGVERSTFIIGPDGSLSHIFPKVKPAAHSDQVLEALT
jgi:peroxiredoxin Q/BCP